MKKSLMFLHLKLDLFLIAILLDAWVSGQTGFFSLDCGGTTNYNDSSGIQWISDTYVQSGKTETIKDVLLLTTQPRQLQTLRSFPQMKKKYCYVLPSLENGTKYLLRASFSYGNYDNRDSPPTFDLLFDSNFWDTISFLNKINSQRTDPEIKELIFMAKSNFVTVCLGRSTDGIPIISSLEIRPALDENMYDTVNHSYALLKLERTNFGADQDIRYPDDPFDRIWEQSAYEAPNISTKRNVSTGLTGNKPPSIVLQTAQTSDANSRSRIVLPNRYILKDGLLYISLYFTELQELNATSTREFDVYLDGKLLYGSLQPKYLECTNISVLKPYGVTTISLSLETTNRSNLSPLLNAWEIYRRSDILQDGTLSRDVKAVTDLQSQFKLKYNSTGDPCLPYNYSWDWLGCRTDPLPARVNSLNLSNEGLKGTIPANIIELTALVSLDLSNNILSGSIPEFLANLTDLEELNLENNNLSGPVPAALANNNKLLLRLSGNRFLCQPEGRNHECSTTNGESGNGKGLIIGLVTAGAVALALLCTAIIISRNRSTRKAAESIPAIPKYLDVPRSREFTYKEVRELTGDFQRQIGRGGFGPVFHGRLHNGLEVAVKVLSEKSKQGSKEFSTEVDLLSRVHHKNLVSLLGYCWEGGHQILIYEYMSNGNLRQLLHGSKTSVHFLDSWENRFDIALNTAQGLEYLHTGCKPRIIHRDVKTANVLLGGQMETKISDFGLSKFGPSGEATHVSTAVKGTFGYLDPEYTITHHLTEKSDVYSFGVVLLEIISGRPPIDTNISGDESHIVPWARSLINQGNVEGIVDQNVGNKFSIAAIWKVAELAMVCTEPRSIDRPTMNEVVMELKEAMRLVNATDPGDYEIVNNAPVRFNNNSSANEISSVPSPSPPGQASTAPGCSTTKESRNLEINLEIADTWNVVNVKKRRRKCKGWGWKARGVTCKGWGSHFRTTAQSLHTE